MHSVGGSSQSQRVKPGGGAFIIYIRFMLAPTSLTGDLGLDTYCITFFFLVHNSQETKASLLLTRLIPQYSCNSVQK